MKSITIHDLDEQLAKDISTYAKRRGLSLSMAVKELLRKRLNLPEKKTLLGYSRARV